MLHNPGAQEGASLLLHVALWWHKQEQKDRKDNERKAKLVSPCEQLYF